MLQFIVLGQVPGTNIYLSYTTVSIGAILLGIGILCYMHRHELKRMLPKRRSHNYIDQIAL